MVKLNAFFMHKIKKTWSKYYYKPPATIVFLALQEQRKQRTPSTTSDDSSKFQSSGSLDRDPCEVELSSSPSAKDFLSRMDSKRKGKNLNPFSSNSSQKAQNSEAIPSRLLQLAKPKEKKDKKKKKGKGQQNQTAGRASVY